MLFCVFIDSFLQTHPQRDSNFMGRLLPLARWKSKDQMYPSIWNNNKARENIWNGGFQDIGQQSVKYSDPWEIRNKRGETSRCPRLLPRGHFPRSLSSRLQGSEQAGLGVLRLRWLEFSGREWETTGLFRTEEDSSRIFSGTYSSLRVRKVPEGGGKTTANE